MYRVWLWLCQFTPLLFKPRICWHACQQYWHFSCFRVFVQKQPGCFELFVWHEISVLTSVSQISHLCIFLPHLLNLRQYLTLHCSSLSLASLFSPHLSVYSGSLLCAHGIGSSYEFLLYHLPNIVYLLLIYTGGVAIFCEDRLSHCVGCSEFILTVRLAQFKKNEMNSTLYFSNYYFIW